VPGDADGMTERVFREFPLVNRPFVDKAVPRERGRRPLAGATATIR
jgi:hypothetical protein